ncbi:GDSL esterase/lipase At1g71250-like [Impatiens glandulifera]|uniref:GDSL esterase/lipase At1g71250-like n=1 Tax=Impatiens glandulifera TaxID=253017 RepID=UPI001FB12021|nr:GDSL esterase/lipase At1g71250-like [Impatiens glandulifera]
MGKSLKELKAMAMVMIVVLQLSSESWRVAEAQVRAMFVFGDSLVDNGNNNMLMSLAKSNYYPYGIDLRGSSHHRFSNGKNFVDYLGDFMGIASPPAFADPTTTGSRIVGGVNYASAGGGILDETGRHYGQRHSLSQQVINFQSTMSQLRRMMSPNNFTQHMSRSIGILVFGSNDYINNYLLPLMYSSSYSYTPQTYANLLLNHYTRQIQALYSLGLRKFYIAGIGPLGCTPSQLITVGSGRCVDNVNRILGTYNEGLKHLVTMLNNGSHRGAMFVYGNTYRTTGDVLNSPATYGFNVVNRSCCGIGMTRGVTNCLPFVPPCFNRNQYVFWDGFNPTQAMNAILARRAYSGTTSDSYPINIQQMVSFFNVV